MPKNILDLDADLALEDDEPQHTKQFRLFGKDWTLVCDLNSFAMSDLTTGDPSAIVRFIDSVILPEQRVDFRTAMTNVKNLTGEKLGKILGALVEAASERPTTPPSGSSGGARSPTSRPKSVASSSRARVVR